MVRVCGYCESCEHKKTNAGPVVPGSKRREPSENEAKERQRKNIIISSFSCRTVAVERGREKMREEDRAMEEDRTEDLSDWG